MTRKRRHHNNVARRSTLRGKRQREVELMVKKIFGKRFLKSPDKLIIREKSNASLRFLAKDDDIEDNNSSVSDQK